jgi:hypothetical protein
MKGILIALLLASSTAAAQSDDDGPTEPCARAKWLEAQIASIGEQAQVLIDAAKPYCKHKRESRAAADRCVELTIQAEAFIADMKRLQVERKAQLKACAAKPKT